ncbi:DUF4172 domain-containing protein [Algibacter lectus]
MARNIWNWQQKKWPHFTYNEDALKRFRTEILPKYRNCSRCF